MKKSLQLLLTLSGSLVLAGQQTLCLAAMPSNPMMPIKPSLESLPPELIEQIIKKIAPSTNMLDLIMLTNTLAQSNKKFKQYFDAINLKKSIKSVLHPVNPYYSHEIRNDALDARHYALDIRKHSPTLFAAASGNRFLMNFINNIDLINPENMLSAAHYAAYYNQPIALSMILKNYPSLANFMDKYSNTPLHIAAQKRHAECVKILLMHKARVDLRNNNGATPYAAAYSNEVRCIIRDHIDGLSDDCPQKQNAILYENTDHDTNLIVAAQENEISHFYPILYTSRNPNLNTQDRDGNTALIWAAKNNNFEMLHALITKPGININAQNNDGDSALIITANNGNLDIVKTLIENGATVNIRNNNGFTALTVTASSGHLDIVQTLLANGADINIQNNAGVTALFFAADHNHLATVQALLAGGATVNTQDNYGGTALMAAADKGHLTILQKLLANEADVNIRTNNGCTALMAAAQRRQLNVVQALLASGADVNIQANNGLTALDYGNDEIKEIIRQHTRLS